MPRKTMQDSRTGRNTTSDATATKLKKLLSSCSACKVSLDCHHFAIMGTTVVSDENQPRIIQFLRYVKQHEWNDLSKFKDWQTERNNLVVYSIACPNGGGMVVVVRSPFELYENDEVYLQETITPEEQLTISKVVPPGEWRAL
jgi:hypothetical protein